MKKIEASFKKQNLLKGNVVTLSFINNIRSHPLSFRANLSIFEFSFLTKVEVGNGKSILILLINDISLAPTITNERILNSFLIELILIPYSNCMLILNSKISKIFKILMFYLRVLQKY